MPVRESPPAGIIYQGGSTISLEVLPAYPHPVVVKRPSSRHASRRNVRSLDREFEMTRALDGVEGVRQALGRESIDDRPALILEYVEGETLSDLVARDTLDLRSRLEIAVEVAGILERIHRRDVVHLDLNSRNVLVGGEPRAVHLIDLGAAFRIRAGGQLKIGRDQILGTLPYISPEQTGRINRAVDERSDLYSLGVVLYELMTGRLPFDSKDPLRLIHHHIARRPVPPSATSPGIPEVASGIILKLLEKDAELRYQSAAGARVDLETCLERLGQDEAIESFPLATADRAARFQYPQKLYGRDEELRVLAHAFEDACRETSSILLVGGYTGIGKTALVEEIQWPVAEGSGTFIRGKFDQVLRTTPYAGISQAFAGFVSKVMAEPEDAYGEWQARVRSAVGDLGKVLTGVVPGLERLIGAQPSVPQLGGQEAENRLHHVFTGFLSAVATREHPLVLFLDDLQWIDAASLRLLSVIRSDFGQPGLLVLGAYRDNEVDASHPLMTLIDDQEKGRLPLRILKLDNLQRATLDALLSDALRTEQGVHELAAAVYEQTRGNPFFFRRLLSSLSEEGRIRHDAGTGIWTWDVDDISAVADNVADLLASTIAKLPAEARDVLQLAACLGHRLDVAALALLAGRTDQEVVELLQIAVSGQYVFALAEAYEFVHDQVQQAAYTLIDERKRTRRHLEIGRSLLAETVGTELDERIFEIATHYSLGASLLTDDAEKRQVAELNLRAGRKSRTSSAFSAAAEYLKEAVCLLGDDGWRYEYELTLDVYNELIDAYYLSLQQEATKDLFDTIVKHARNDIDSWMAYRTMIMSKVAANELEAAISLADEYLPKLHVSFDTERDPDLSAAELRALPPMEDREKRAAMEILLAIHPPMVMSAPERLPSLYCTMLNIIGRHGNSEISSFAVSCYAMLLCLEDRYEEGNVYGQLAVDLLQQYPSEGMSTKVINTQNALIRPWKSSVHELIAPLKDYHHIGMRAGEIEWCLYSLTNYTLLLWSTGKPLRDYLLEADPCIRLCASNNQEVIFLICSFTAEAASNLMATSKNTTRLEGDWFSEENMRPRLEGRAQALSFYRSIKIMLSLLFDDYQGAYRQTDEALRIRIGLNPHYLYSKISFYGALSCIATLEGGEDEGGRQERLERLEMFEGELKRWAESAPMNFAHQYHLVLAEEARASGNPWQAVQLYESAIQQARENHFVHDAALANELCARFWQGCGYERIAETYMREARAWYHQWGAAAKVGQLEKGYPQWFETRTSPAGPPDTPGSADVTISQPITPARVDLEGVLKATHALASETDLDELLATMLELVMSTSGAARVVLLLRQAGDWFVQARGDAATGKHEILLDRRFDPADGGAGLVPEPVFHYCRRSKEPLIVDDARADPRFAADDMIRAHDVRSMLCIPASSRGELTAMLYFENRQMAGAFLREHVETLEHLAAQFAVSVEKALLYEDLNRKVRELQESDERYELAVAGSDAGLWDWNVVSNELYTSDRFKELLGFAPDEISITMDWFWDRLHPNDYPAVRRAVDRHLEERAPYRMEYRLQTRSGEYRWFYARGQALWDEAGRATRMSGSVTDIHRRKQAEKAAREQRDALARLDRATRMGHLTAAIAHELNQPLTGILSGAQAAELLIEGGQGQREELAEIMSEIVADARRAGDVVHGLRELYREQTGDFSPVDLNAVVADTAQLLHGELETREVELAIERASSLPGVKGNAVQLQQVLVNVIMNGIEAMRGGAREDRRLRVVTAYDAEEVGVWVEDRGPGIDPDRIERIFEPLATWRPGGTGMGLAISKSIVEAHGGRMWAENLPEGGARVGFAVPVLKEESRHE